MSTDKLYALREFNKEAFRLTSELPHELKIPQISLLSMILSIHGRHLFKLRQLTYLKENSTKGEKFNSETISSNFKYFKNVYVASNNKD